MVAPDERRPEPVEVIRRALRELEVTWEERTPGRIAVTMPGERKLRTECVLEVGSRAVDLHAFVIRHPEENHAEVYRFLLERNLRMRQISFAVDHAGDIHLVGSLPLALFRDTGDPAAGEEAPATGQAPATGRAEATGRADAGGASGASGPAELLDGLLGEVLTASDSSFNRILELGFAESIRREWAWRLRRGESTRNLEAFRHLRPNA